MENKAVKSSSYNKDSPAILNILKDFWTNHNDGAKYLMIKVIVGEKPSSGNPKLYISLQKYWDDEMDQLLFEDTVGFIENPILENTMLIIELSKLPNCSPISIKSIDIHEIVLNYNESDVVSSDNTITFKNINHEDISLNRYDYTKIEGKPVTGVMYSLANLENINKEGNIDLKLRDDALCVTITTNGFVFNCTIGEDSEESNYEKEWEGNIPRSLQYWKKRCKNNDDGKVVLPISSNLASCSIQGDYFEALSVFPLQLK